MFLGAAGLGTALGLVYDLFRILRRRVRLPLLGSALDLPSGLWSPRGSFSMPSPPGAGSCAYYVVLAPLPGGGRLFSLALSRPALFLAGLVADGIAFLWKLCTFPLVLLKHVRKKLKKLQRSTSIMAEDGIILD